MTLLELSVAYLRARLLGTCLNLLLLALGVGMIVLLLLFSAKMEERLSRDAAGLDLVIGAVHSQFHLSRSKQTTRILKAMDHPHFTMLAHPTGRLLQEREPYDVDMARIIRHARTRGCFLELNAHPERLDLLDSHCRLAKDEGVLVSINSDAHSVLDFGHLRLGIGQARRGWLSAPEVLNTRALRELRKLLRQTM